jgi:hypothetical protein
MRTRFWCEVGLGAVSGVTFLATLLWHDWIEVIFGVEPDGGDGSLEWLIVVVTATLAIGSFLLAHIEWRRAHRRAA